MISYYLTFITVSKIVIIITIYLLHKGKLIYGCVKLHRDIPSWISVKFNKIFQKACCSINVFLN